VFLRDAMLSLGERTRGRANAIARAASEKVSSPFLVPGVRDPELRAAVRLVNERLQAMIDERRRQGLSQRDLLTLLLTAKDPDGSSERMSDRQVRDEAVTIFVAGHETTATALAWSFYLLARHPDVLERVRAEADAFAAGPIERWEPDRLAVTTRVFREALRLYTPITMLPRRTTEEVEIAGVRIPKRTIVLVSAYAQHYRTDSYPDPERFDPDRWLPDRETTRHRRSYLPFSAGPRFCLGAHFAMMEGPLVLSQLLRRFDFEIDARKTIDEDDFATLRPRGGVPAIVRARRASARAYLK
jgi:cytochrome P450